MARVVLRERAIEDLNIIWDYTFKKWSESQADKYYAMLKQSCADIGKNPGIGNKFAQIRENLRGLHSGRHIIFYETINKDEVEVIRILHERMDLKTRLSE
jgi:toxin ParE1/3/4